MPRSLRLLLLLTLALTGWQAPQRGMAQTPSESDIAVTTDSVAAEQIPSSSQPTKRKGNFLVRFIERFDDIDTTYIAPNYYNYEAMVQNTNFFQTYRIEANNAAGQRQSMTLAPSSSVRIGPYLGYRWLFLGYTFDIGNPSNATKTTELNISLYSSMLGIDLTLLRNTGDFHIQRISGVEGVSSKSLRGADFTGAETYTAAINAYYVFNHRRFSYPAAFAQSTVQRKSAGSWMLGFRFDQQRLKFDPLKAQDLIRSVNPQATLLDEMHVTGINYRQYAVSVGYGYNWVFARNWLLSASIAPSIGFKKQSGQRLDGKALWLNIRHFNVDCVTRLGLVWNNTRYYAGLSAVNYIYDYRRERFALINVVNYINLYVGLNFHKRKQYRHP